MTVLHFAQALTPSGWQADVLVRVVDGAIAGVEAGVPPGPAERHAIGLPGLASLHSHAFQRGMAGLAEHRQAGPDSFWTWRKVMYDFALAIEPDEAEAIAAMLYCEMLETGFTSVGEFHYLHHARDGADYANVAEMAGRVLGAAAETGIGMTILPVFYARSGFGAQTTSPGQRRFATGLDRYARLLEATRRLAAGAGNVVVGTAPHSLRAATPDEVRAVAALAAGGPVHIHVAEQLAEVEECLAHTGTRPVSLLLDSAQVDGSWCLVHATHMEAGEHRAVARAGATVGLCPVTEANLGDGIFDMPSFMEAGGRFGIGTDSNVSIGVAEELRMLEYAQRLGRKARNVTCPPESSTGRFLHDTTLAGSAAALGGDPAGLTEGARADIVSLDAHDTRLAGASGDRILDGWIFSAGSRAVDAVWAGGKKLVSAGRHIGRDPIERRFKAALARVVQRL